MFEGVYGGEAKRLMMVMMRHRAAGGWGGPGFTLVELLTVVAIMVVVMGVMLPAAGKLMRGNNQKQALNMVSAMVAAGRATALSTRTPVAVVFYEDPNYKNQTSVMMLRMTGQSGGVSTFDVIAGREAEPLPAGVKVGTLQGVGAGVAEVVSASQSTGTQTRVIVFDHTGQMVLWNQLQGTAAVTALIPKLNGTVDSASSPAVVVYDERAMQALGFAAGDDPGRSNWIMRNGDVVVVNAFTGNVIR